MNLEALKKIAADYNKDPDDGENLERRCDASFDYFDQMLAVCEAAKAYALCDPNKDDIHALYGAMREALAELETPAGAAPEAP